MTVVCVDAFKSVFLGRERGVRAARVLFDYYIDESDSRGRVRRGKDEIAATLKVSGRTVANYIYALTALDLIKRKYDGQTILNPKYYYRGDAAELEGLKKEYADFRSDYK